MSHLPPPPFPRALHMPLRDILRGVSSVADLTEDALEPAAALLPAPLRDPFRAALSVFEDAGTRAAEPDVNGDTIARAVRYLASGDGDVDDMVRVLAFGWDRLHAGHPEHAVMFSETVAATSIATRTGGAQPQFARAAQILLGLRHMHAAGPFPGTPVEASAADQTYIDQALIAIFAWLFAERPETLDEDIRVLELSFALTRALGSDVLDSLADEAALALQIQSLADHI